MSKCPFWSSERKRVECNDECPMNNFFSIKDNCPFKEYMDDSAIKIKGIDEGDYSYKDDIVLSYIPKIKR